MQGKSGTSNNMLAVSTMTAILYSLKTLLVQFDRTSNPLNQAFESGRNKNMLNEEFSFYNKKGLDEVFERAKMKTIETSLIQDNSVQVKHTNLYYMPPSRMCEEELKREADEVFIRSFLEQIGRFESINFIDCMNGRSEVSHLLFQNSDLIVVNLFQGIEGFEELMEEPLIRSKALFVVGRYDQNSRDTLQNIRRKYNIAKDAIGVIPYNIHFHDAVNDGKLVQFMTRGIFAKKTDVDYDFIMEVYRTTNMILRKAGYEGI